MHDPIQATCRWYCDADYDEVRLCKRSSEQRCNFVYINQNNHGIFYYFHYVSRLHFRSQSTHNTHHRRLWTFCSANRCAHMELEWPMVIFAIAIPDSGPATPSVGMAYIAASASRKVPIPDSNLSTVFRHSSADGTPNPKGSGPGHLLALSLYTRRRIMDASCLVLLQYSIG